MNLNKIPNILTIIRICLTPIIVFFIFFKIEPILYTYRILEITASFKTNEIIAGILFIIASMTDFFDGYLSRKKNWISEFGKIWDPIADKILINSLLISFAIKGFVPYFIPILFIIRDTIVDAMRMNAIKTNLDVDVSANIFGKLKTVFQIISIIFILFIANDNSLNPNYFLSENWEYYIIQNLFIFISLFTSFISGYIYIEKRFKKFR